MKKIAITGGIAEGKSTVLRYCREDGYEVASADDLARQVFDLPEVQLELAALLGSTSGNPSRREVREAAAVDPQFRRALNRLTHPRIVAALGSSRASIVEAPLLVETCLLGEFARIWVVTCGLEEQLRRLSARYGEDAGRKMASLQLPSSAKTPFADRIIRTNADEENVKRYVSVIAKSDLGDLRSA